MFTILSLEPSRIPPNCKNGNVLQYPRQWQRTETHKVTTMLLPNFPSLKYLLCPSDFQVFINSTGSNVNEGDDITLTCVHNLPDLELRFWWEKGGEEVLESQNQSQLVFEKVLSYDEGEYICFVDSPCGHYESSPHDVTVKSK